MDKLIESVSEVLGPKWEQLYFKLGLDSAGRFKIQTRYQFESQPLAVKIRHRNCAHDTLVSWQESKKSAKGLTEKDKMKQLLITLSEMDGFGDIAQKLGVENGIHIEPPSRRDAAPEHKASVGKPKTHSSSTTQATSSIHTRSPKQSTSQGRPNLVKTDLKSDSGHSTSLSQVSGHGSPRLARMVGSDAATSAPHNQSTPINLNNTRHKYAILDAAQRIEKSCWRQMATNLEISERTIQTLAKERAVEERYYKMIKEWITFKGEGATFEVLKNVLETNSQTIAIEAMASRLEDVHI